MSTKSKSYGVGSAPHTPAAPEGPTQAPGPGVQDGQGDQDQAAVVAALAVVSQLLADDRGVSFASGKRLMGLVIGVSVAVLVASAIFLPSINDYAGGNTDNLTGPQQTVNGLIVIFGLLALALAFINEATD